MNAASPKGPGNYESESYAGRFLTYCIAVELEDRCAEDTNVMDVPESSITYTPLAIAARSNSSLCIRDNVGAITVM